MTIDVPIESPQGHVLNYSIVSSDEDDDNPLVLKLKLSDKNNVPLVVLKRLDDDDMFTVSPRTSTRLRKTKKNDEIDMDYSPKKLRSTPKKSHDIDELCSSIKERVTIKTPLKRAGDSDEESPSKRTTTTPRRSRRPQSVKVNLNESFRRSILKSRHNSDNIITPRRSSRVTRTHSYCDSDEAIEVAEALKKSEIEVSRRVLRSRSNSLSSNDADWKSTRSRTNSSDYSPERAQRAPLAKTPKSRKVATPKTTPKTPRNRLKMLREGAITPSMHSRSSLVPQNTTPLMQARSKLHVSYVPSSLPCREKEYLDVFNFVRGKLEDGCGGCMYISGVPGTGKTATVTSAISQLTENYDFDHVNINGMRLTEPRQSYVEIWKQLSGKTLPWEHAQSLLEEKFTKKKSQKAVVMLIDELDILCTKRQDVVYNLLDWPSKSKNQLIVITIANTMDLPERLLMSRVTSRLGLTRLTFQAYTFKQLMEIVSKRLLGIESFNGDAIQLVARKVASVSGDARRALDICRRAAEIAEENGGQMVGITHINEALNAMITQPHVMTIKRCSRLQKLTLQAIVAEIERTGVEETTFSDIFRMLVSCCALDGFKMVSSTVAQRALSGLSACKLILTDQKCGDIYQRVVLNVSVHDVYFALKNE